MTTTDRGNPGRDAVLGEPSEEGLRLDSPTLLGDPAFVPDASSLPHEATARGADQLVQATTLPTQGGTAAVLAHELNQPLAAIANYARACYYQVVDLRGANRDAALDAVQQIAAQADRAGRLIRRLRMGLNGRTSSRESTDVNDLVRNVAAWFEGEMRRHDVALHLALDDRLPAVAVDRLQIEQVLTNLLSNAVEAACEVPKKERSVTIRTSRESTSQETGGRLVVAVEDTGKGLPKKNARCFEPFSTTKIEGMGLGLAICRWIVEAHGGRLEAGSGSERGAQFRFTLPAAAAGAGEDARKHGDVG